MAIIDNFEKMLAAGQDTALLRYSLGNEYLKLGDAVSAARHLQHAVQHDQGYSAAWKLLGKALADSQAPADALAAAKKFEVAAGRGRLFSGAGKSTVIDDTYNASPQAVMASLDVLEHFPKPRVAVLGDMRELGQAREAGHAAVGEYAAHRVEHLITLGEDARLIAQAAEEAGMSPGRIHQSESAEDAAAAAGRAAANGTVLVKGSQGVYLERVVKELLADPRDESRLVQRPIPEDAP